MKKFFFLAAAFVGLTAFTTTVSTWTNDPAHSQMAFTVTHLGIADISGTFNDFKVTVNSTKSDFSDASFELTAKTASIDTSVEARNKHLKSADFFNVEKYETLTFKSSGLKKSGKDGYKLTGDLTLHGVSKPVIMDLVYKGTVKNPMSKEQTAGFHITGTIKRSDFSIGEKFPTAIISDEVQIKADGEFVAE